MVSHLVFLPALLLTLIALPLLNRFAKRVGLVDHPSARKMHSNATPLTGGIAIACGLLALAIFSPTTLVHFKWILLGSFILLLTGVADDIKDLRVNLRLALQFAAASLVIFGGDLRIEHLGNLLFFGNIELGLLSIPLTYFALLAGINAVNLVDGLDGLAGTLMLVPLLLLALLTAHHGLADEFSFITTLAGSILGFLCLNFRFPWIKSAKTFLGDAGSTTLGFILSCLFIHLSQGTTAILQPVSILWLFAIPLIDTATVIVLRKLRGDSAFKASKDHLHHVLIQRGLNVRQTVGFIGISATAFGGTALFASEMGIADGILFLAFVAFLTYHFICVRAIVRSEVQTIKPYDFGLRLIEKKLNKLEQVNQQFNQFELNKKRNDAA
jgi:UDP-GlcNAc:undecaprenyl-phosphate GlcNAc-1-phosphate transferase